MTTTPPDPGSAAVAVTGGEDLTQETGAMLSEFEAPKNATRPARQLDTETFRQYAPVKVPGHVDAQVTVHLRGRPQSPRDAATAAVQALEAALAAARAKLAQAPKS